MAGVCKLVLEVDQLSVSIYLLEAKQDPPTFEPFSCCKRLLLSLEDTFTLLCLIPWIPTAELAPTRQNYFAATCGKELLSRLVQSTFLSLFQSIQVFLFGKPKKRKVEVGSISFQYFWRDNRRNWEKIATMFWGWFWRHTISSRATTPRKINVDQGLMPLDCLIFCPKRNELVSDELFHCIIRCLGCEMC